MTKTQQICQHEQCSGCAACFIDCRHDAIRMVADEEGFLRPNINADACIDCGLCVRVCPANTKIGRHEVPLLVYSGWSKNDEIRLSSASGGAFAEIASYFITEMQGVVFGVAMNDKLEACHVAITETVDLKRLQGSKYIQRNIIKLGCDMKVLWFEVTEPSAYSSSGVPIAGWQDSLERIVRTVSDIELTISFVSKKKSEVSVINGVTYVPIHVDFTFYERKFRKTWDVYVAKLLPAAKRIIDEYKPDLIHVFGTEWPFGQVASVTDIPVVIHIMGAIVPYNNASYPPGFSYSGQICHYWWNPKKVFGLWSGRRNQKNWEKWERSTWRLVSNYMGRTQWDKSLSNVMHPGRRYFHVDEALRTEFLSGKNGWRFPADGKLRLISTGCSTFWKGPDMMLKVARILTDLGLPFEWQVAGNMLPIVKETTEKQVGVRFEDCNIKILGFTQPAELMRMLCSSTMYVHTAYIENSPNSICEAQCLGVPVVSTNVGGIASLVRQDVDGILVPANDPWQMADAIIELSKDRERMKRYSDSSRNIALARHNDENIKKQLLECYMKLRNRDEQNFTQ